VPGFDNWGSSRRDRRRRRRIPELAFMVEVEDGGPKWNVHGDQSSGVNDFHHQGQALFVNQQAPASKSNFNANPDLLPSRTLPTGVKLIVPRYRRAGQFRVVPAGVPSSAISTATTRTPRVGPTDIIRAT